MEGTEENAYDSYMNYDSGLELLFGQQLVPSEPMQPEPTRHNQQALSANTTAQFPDPSQEGSGGASSHHMHQNDFQHQPAYYLYGSAREQRSVVMSHYGNNQMDVSSESIVSPAAPASDYENVQEETPITHTYGSRSNRSSNYFSGLVRRPHSQVTSPASAQHFASNRYLQQMGGRFSAGQDPRPPNYDEQIQLDGRALSNPTPDQYRAIGEAPWSQALPLREGLYPWPMETSAPQAGRPPATVPDRGGNIRSFHSGEQGSTDLALNIVGGNVRHAAPFNPTCSNGPCIHGLEPHSLQRRAPSSMPPPLRSVGRAVSRASDERSTRLRKRKRDDEPPSAAEPARGQSEHGTDNDPPDLHFRMNTHAVIHENNDEGRCTVCDISYDKHVADRHFAEQHFTIDHLICPICSGLVQFQPVWTSADGSRMISEPRSASGDQSAQGPWECRECHEPLRDHEILLHYREQHYFKISSAYLCLLTRAKSAASLHFGKINDSGHCRLHDILSPLRNTRADVEERLQWFTIRDPSYDIVRYDFLEGGRITGLTQLCKLHLKLEKRCRLLSICPNEAFRRVIHRYLHDSVMEDIWMTTIRDHPYAKAEANLRWNFNGREPSKLLRGLELLFWHDDKACPKRQTGLLTPCGCVHREAIAPRELARMALDLAKLPRKLKARDTQD